MTHQEHLNYVLAHHARHNRNAEIFRDWLKVSPVQKLDITIRDSNYFRMIQQEIKKSL